MRAEHLFVRRDYGRFLSGAGLVAYGGHLYYNPGIPAVRAFVQDAMMDAVRRYDIDGVHWDDYFYSYPVSGAAFPDQATYAQYGAGFATVADWRRNNVNLLVQEMGAKIRAAKPWVRFGISPSGIWRNAGTDPLGSRTTGLQSYDAIYADTRRWVRQGWIDYIVPQLYWHIGFAAADYPDESARPGYAPTPPDGPHGQSGRSQSTPSGGTWSAADAGIPCHGTASACTSPRLPTPDPP